MIYGIIITLRSAFTLIIVLPEKKMRKYSFSTLTGKVGAEWRIHSDVGTFLYAPNDNLQSDANISMLLMSPAVEAYRELCNTVGIFFKISSI